MTHTLDSPAHRGSPAATAGVGRLLVVDDEVQLMTALCEMLPKHGYETVGFTSGQEALEALKEQDFDLLLADLMMPEMDGITLLQSALDINPNLVGIIMTGQGTVPTAVEAMKRGAFDYVLKPFKLQALLPTLSRAMGVRQLRVANVQLRETVAIYELSMATAFALDPTSILIKAAEGALQQCQADEVSIMLPTPRGDELYVAVVRGERPRPILGERVPIDRSIAGWVARQQQPVTLQGEVNAPRFAPINPRPEIQEAISMPMLAGGKLVGVLNLNAKGRRRTFTLGQVKALNILCSLAASALENARLFGAQEQATRKTRSLYEIAQSLTTVLESEKVLHLIAVKTTELLGTPHAQVVLWDEATQTLRLGAAYGTEADWVRQQVFPLGEGVNGLVAQTRKPLIVNDYQDSPHRVPWLTELVAVIGVPLLYRGRLLGVLSSHATQPGFAFTQEHLDLLTSFANQAAIAIENARLYEEIRQHAAKLEERVRERTQELAAANEQLAAASRHKSEFLANMSHELRTPLNSVIGFSELLLEHGVGPLNDKQQRYMTHIRNSGTHLVQLISDILDIAKVEAGKIALQPEALPVAATLEDILVIARGLANKKSQTIQTEIESDLPRLLADPVRFKQILFNLLSNAVKFTPDGGLITVTARKVTGDEGTGEPEKRGTGELPAPIPPFPDSPIPVESHFLEIKVRDTGVGIRPEDIPRLFREFVQLETTPAQHQEGTGLGLALTKKLVELHGGQIWASSGGEGQGSTFTVLLPIAGPGTGTS